MLKKRWSLAALLTLLLFAYGCGADDAPQLSVSSIAPGATCEAGGTLLEIDGEEYVICDGIHGEDGADGEDGDSPEISTERVDADDSDNPCGTEALKVSIAPADGGDPIVEYICDSMGSGIEIEPAPEDECVADGIRVRFEDDQGNMGEWILLCDSSGEPPVANQNQGENQIEPNQTENQGENQGE